MNWKEFIDFAIPFLGWRELCLEDTIDAGLDPEWRWRVFEFTWGTFGFILKGHAFAPREVQP